MASCRARTRSSRVHVDTSLAPVSKHFGRALFFVLATLSDEAITGNGTPIRRARLNGRINGLQLVPDKSAPLAVFSTTKAQVTAVTVK